MSDQSTSVTSRFKSLLGFGSGGESSSETRTCKHEEINRGHIDEDESIWYVRSRERGDETHWEEKDAAYILTRELTTEYVCLGCGETHTIHTAERVGGPEGIKLKEEMSDEELEEFREKVFTGGFYNGWPDHYDDHFMPDGGLVKSSTDTERSGGGGR